jgi:hypothetical protein
MVHRNGMLRLLGEDLAVKPLGFEQLPGLVLLQCQIESVLDRELSHAVDRQYPVWAAL